MAAETDMPLFIEHTGMVAVVCHIRIEACSVRGNVVALAGLAEIAVKYDLAVENTPNADIVTLAKVTDVVSEILGGKLDAGYIETAVANAYAKNYPDLYVAFDVPYDVAGSAVGVVKGNAELLAGVNEAIAAALSDGSMAAFVAEANELASGSIYEGLLD